MDEVENIAYKNLLYGQALLQKHGNKWKKTAIELRSRDKAYVQKHRAKKNWLSASLNNKYWEPFLVKWKVKQNLNKLKLSL